MAMNSFEEGPSGGPSAMVLSKVSAPAIALIVTGVLNVLLGIYNFISSLMFSLSGPEMMQQDPQFQQMQERMQQDMAAEGMPIDLAQLMQIMQGLGWVGVVLSLVSLALGAFIIMGGLRMKQLQSRGMAVAASILAMIPCISCCVIGLPIGIWALIVLNNPEVKAAFR